MGNRNKINHPIAYYTGLGAALGAAFGAAFNDVAIGVALGVAIGAGIGTSLKKKQDKDVLNKGEAGNPG